jgi:hypothetical protein
MEELLKILFYLQSSKLLDPEIQKIIYTNLWSLY